MVWVKHISILLSLLITFSPISALSLTRRDRNTLYVSSAGVYCDFKTISEALEAAGPGTTIMVRDGVYRESLITINKSGLLGEPITIKAENKHGPLLLGSIVVLGEYITIDGLKMDGDGKVTTHAIHLQRPYAKVVNMDIRNYVNYAVYADSTRGSVVGGHSAYIANNYTANMLAGFNVTFDTTLEYNVMKGVTTFGTTGANGDFCRIFGNNVIVRGNFYYGTKAEDLRRPGLDDVHADFIQTWDDVAVEVKNILVEDNIVYGKYHQGIMLENDRYAPEGTYYISDWIIRNNVFAGYTAWGICAGKINGGIPNLTIVNNTFVGDTHNNTKTWHGVGLVGMGGTGIIKNNIFVGQYSTSYFASEGASIESDNNLIYNSPIPANQGKNDIIGSDPMFVSYDPELKEEELLRNDYRLQDVSPAIDRGADLGLRVDADGNQRPIGVGTDIGAFEFQGKPGNVAPILAISGVNNGDVVKENTSLSVEVEATDADGISKVEFYQDNQLIQSATSEPYKFRLTPQPGAHSFYAVGYDKTGLSGRSGLVNIFVSNLDYVSGEGVWKSQALEREYRDVFSAEFSWLPLMGETNSVVGLSNGPSTAYGNIAVGIRLSPDGKIDARNAGEYVAETEVFYEPGQLYHIRVDVDVVSQSYDAYVTTEQGRTMRLATGYKFRDTPNVLTHWATFAESGSTRVFGFKSGRELERQTQGGGSVGNIYLFRIDDPSIGINGMNIEAQDLEAPTPVLMDGEPYIPIRTLSDILGAKLEWRAEDGNIYIETTDDIIEFWVGNTEAYLNGKLITLTNPAIIIDDRTQIPLTFVIEAFQLNAEWDEEKEEIVLYQQPK